MKTLKHNECVTLDEWDCTNSIHYGYIYSLYSSMKEDLEYYKETGNTPFYQHMEDEIAMYEKQEDFTNGFVDIWGQETSLIGFIPKLTSVESLAKYPLDKKEWDFVTHVSYGEQVIIDGQVFEVIPDEDDADIRIAFKWVKKA